MNILHMILLLVAIPFFIYAIFKHKKVSLRILAVIIIILNVLNFGHIMGLADYYRYKGAYLIYDGLNCLYLILFSILTYRKNIIKFIFPLLALILLFVDYLNIYTISNYRYMETLIGVILSSAILLLIMISSLLYTKQGFVPLKAIKNIFKSNWAESENSNEVNLLINSDENNEEISLVNADVEFSSDAILSLINNAENEIQFVENKSDNAFAKYIKNLSISNKNISKNAYIKYLKASINALYVLVAEITNDDVLTSEIVQEKVQSKLSQKNIEDLYLTKIFSFYKSKNDVVSEDKSVNNVVSDDKIFDFTNEINKDNQDKNNIENANTNEDNKKVKQILKVKTGLAFKVISSVFLGLLFISFCYNIIYTKTYYKGNIHYKTVGDSVEIVSFENKINPYIFDEFLNPGDKINGKYITKMNQINGNVVVVPEKVKHCNQSCNAIIKSNDFQLNQTGDYYVPEKYYINYLEKAKKCEYAIIHKYTEMKEGFVYDGNKIICVYQDFDNIELPSDCEITPNVFDNTTWYKNISKEGFVYINDICYTYFVPKNTVISKYDENISKPYNVKEGTRTIVDLSNLGDNVVGLPSSVTSIIECGRVKLLALDKEKGLSNLRNFDSNVQIINSDKTITEIVKVKIVRQANDFDNKIINIIDTDEKINFNDLYNNVYIKADKYEKIKNEYMSDYIKPYDKVLENGMVVYKDKYIDCTKYDIDVHSLSDEYRISAHSLDNTLWFNGCKNSVIYIKNTLYHINPYYLPISTLEVREGTKYIVDDLNLKDYNYIHLPQSVTNIYVSNGSNLYFYYNDSVIPDNIEYIDESVQIKTKCIGINNFEQLSDSDINNMSGYTWIFSDKIINLDNYNCLRKNKIIINKKYKDSYAKFESFSFYYFDEETSLVFNENNDLVFDFGKFDTIVLNENVSKINELNRYSDTIVILNETDVIKLHHLENKKFYIKESIINQYDKYDNNKYYSFTELDGDLVVDNGKVLLSVNDDFNDISQITSKNYNVNFNCLNNTKFHKNAGSGAIYIGNILYGFKGYPSGNYYEVKDGTTTIADGWNIYNVKLQLPDSVKYIGNANKSNNFSYKNNFIPGDMIYIGKNTQSTTMNIGEKVVDDTDSQDIFISHKLIDFNAYKEFFKSKKNIYIPRDVMDSYSQDVLSNDKIRFYTKDFLIYESKNTLCSYYNTNYEEVLTMFLDENTEIIKYSNNISNYIKSFVVAGEVSGFENYNYKKIYTKNNFYVGSNNSIMNYTSIENDLVIENSVIVACIDNELTDIEKIIDTGYNIKYGCLSNTQFHKKSDGNIYIGDIFYYGIKKIKNGIKRIAEDILYPRILELPQSVKYIGNQLSKYEIKVRYDGYYIPNDMEYIGENVEFYGENYIGKRFSNIHNTYISADNVIDLEIYKDILKDRIYVDASLLDAYKAKYPSYDFYSIE